MNEPGYCLKELRVTPGWMCSTHRHKVKSETFIVVSGHPRIEVASRGAFRHPGEIIHVPAGTIHLFAAYHGCPVSLLEVSTHHDDADVERLFESQPFPSTSPAESDPCRRPECHPKSVVSAQEVSAEVSWHAASSDGRKAVGQSGAEGRHH